MSDDDDKKFDLTKDPAFQEVQRQLKGLGMIVTQQSQSSKKLTESVSALVGKLDGITTTRKDDDEDEDEDALNDLDNKQLVKLVLGEVGKVLDKKLEGVGTKIDATANRLDEAEVKRQVVELGAKDFFEWGDEISSLAKDNPGLNVKQLYRLARDEDPEKATKLDEKYLGDDKGGKGDGKDFLSLMPTSGATFDDETEKLTTEEAKEKAWQETIDEFPGLANLGEG
jgi:uncharacterized coiled-coil protein SlyX